MPADTTSALLPLLFDSLVIAFLVFGAVAAITGIGLIAGRERTLRLLDMMNRHVSTRQALKSASAQHDITHTVQNYRWWFALAIVAGAAYSLYSLLWRFDPALVTEAIAGATAGPLAASLIEGLRWFMIIFSGIACVVGLLLAVAPDLLRAIETRSNRWYSMRRITAPLETPNPALDRWVEAHPLIAGWSITIGALIVVASSAIILFGK